ncbi:MAG TPA: UxaA family hydrolase [Casimicrobiaceae bacterium]
MPDVMKLAPQDNVAVALRPLRAGEAVTLDGASLTVDRDVAVGHKVAACDIAPGATITKYNCPIGIATQAIAAGEYVHTHNVKSGYLPTYTLT